MFLPKKWQAILEKNRFYLYIRYKTPLYQLWLLVRKDVRKQNEAKNKLYRQIISTNCKLIFDIGANEGMLTNIFSRLSQRVIAIEPSRRNLAILHAKFSTNKNIIIVPVAVSSNSGKHCWYEDTTDYAMGTLSRKWNDLKPNKSGQVVPQTFITTITLDALLLQFGVPDYVKIDVEGNELQVLSGLSKRLPFLSFEAILPQFLDEAIQCIERLSIIAQTVFNYSYNDEFVYKDYITKEQLIIDIKTLNQTIDIFCKMV